MDCSCFLRLSAYTQLVPNIFQLVVDRRDWKAGDTGDIGPVISPEEMQNKVASAL